MGKRHIPESHTAHPNVTPLIDIVMCLIIFFMLVAKIGVTTGAEPMKDLPTAVLGKSIEDMGNVLILNVYPSPVESDENPMITAMVKDPTTGQEARKELRIMDPGGARFPLREVLKFYRFGADMKKGGDGNNADNDKFKVVIRGQSNLKYQFIEKVLLECAQSNVASVNLATSPKTVEAP